MKLTLTDQSCRATSSDHSYFQREQSAKLPILMANANAHSRFPRICDEGSCSDVAAHEISPFILQRSPVNCNCAARLCPFTGKINEPHFWPKFPEVGSVFFLLVASLGQRRKKNAGSSSKLESGNNTCPVCLAFEHSVANPRRVEG